MKTRKKHSNHGTTIVLPILILFGILAMGDASYGSSYGYGSDGAYGFGSLRMQPTMPNFYTRGAVAQGALAYVGGNVIQPMLYSGGNAFNGAFAFNGGNVIQPTIYSGGSPFSGNLIVNAGNVVQPTYSGGGLGNLMGAITLGGGNNVIQPTYSGSGLSGILGGAIALSGSGNVIQPNLPSGSASFGSIILNPVQLPTGCNLCGGQSFFRGDYSLGFSSPVQHVENIYTTPTRGLFRGDFHYSNAWYVLDP
ncbi:MAG TPA: hypothetical protein VJB05_00075 [archaeon]|nr:hypothetical protein [archaeon]